MTAQEIQYYSTFFNALTKVIESTDFGNPHYYNDYVTFISWSMLNGLIVDDEMPFYNEDVATILINFGREYNFAIGSEDDDLYLPYPVADMLLTIATADSDEDISEVVFVTTEEPEEAEEIIETSKLDEIHDLLFKPSAVQAKPKKLTKKERGEEIKRNYKALSRLRILNS